MPSLSNVLSNQHHLYVITQKKMFEGSLPNALHFVQPSVSKHWRHISRKTYVMGWKYTMQLLPSRHHVNRETKDNTVPCGQTSVASWWWSIPAGQQTALPCCHIMADQARHSTSAPAMPPSDWVASSCTNSPIMWCRTSVHHSVHIPTENR